MFSYEARAPARPPSVRAKARRLWTCSGLSLAVRIGLSGMTEPWAGGPSSAGFRKTIVPSP